MAKIPLRKVRDSSANDLTKGYRPTEDWSQSVEEILQQLPPTAFEPPGSGPQRPTHEPPKSEAQTGSQGAKTEP